VSYNAVADNRGLSSVI